MDALSHMIGYGLLLLCSTTIAAEHCVKPVKEHKNCSVEHVPEVANYTGLNPKYYSFDETRIYSCPPSANVDEKTTLMIVFYYIRGDNQSPNYYVYFSTKENETLSIKLHCSNDKYSGKALNEAKHTLITKEHNVGAISCTTDKAAVNRYRTRVNTLDNFHGFNYTSAVAA